MSEKMTLEKLAVMIKNGFDETGEKISGVENRLTGVETELKEFKEQNKREHEEMIRENKREHEEITLRLDNVAYRFELVELTRRVEKLEKMVGAPKSKAPQVKP